MPPEASHVGSVDLSDIAGENISSVEIEGMLVRHPAVLEAAVLTGLQAFAGEADSAHFEATKRHAIFRLVA